MYLQSKSNVIVLLLIKQKKKNGKAEADIWNE